MSRESESEFESGGSGSGGLLSKVVRFVKSPTHWYDLDRANADSGDLQSRQLLKEMIERKKRNDFVRNREFDMLRKLRRKETLTDRDLRPGPASFFSSSQPAGSTEERARTLKKIDEIEAQMAHAWFRRKGDQALQQAAAPQGRGPAPAAAAVPPPPPVDGAASPAPGNPVDGRPLSPGISRAFAPTTPMSDAELQAVGLEPRPAPPPPQQPLLPPQPQLQPQPPLQPPPQLQPQPPQPPSQPPPPMPPHLDAIGKREASPDTIVESAKPRTPMPMPVFGDVTDFQVEVVAGTKLLPAIEEAAIRYANGDAAGAEAGLRELVAHGGAREDDVDTWLILFDLYRLMGEQGKFDEAGLHFAASFGRSAPQWGVEAGADSQTSAPAPIAAKPASSSSTTKFHWVCPSALNASAVTALDAALRRYAPPWRVDWRYVKTIDAEALPALDETFQRWVESPVQLRFLGVESLLGALAEQSPPENRQVDPLWWKTRLALLRALGEMEEFDMVALNYCVTYEVSPPAWEDPKNGYSPLSEEGQTIIGQEPKGAAKPSSSFDPSSHGFVPTDLMSEAPAAPDNTVVRADLAGELLGAAADAIKRVHPVPVTRAIDLNCRELRRVDFGAAGDLLNWAMEQKTEGRQVSFRHVNRMVAAFFGVIGITEAARVILRID